MGVLDDYITNHAYLNAQPASASVPPPDVPFSQRNRAAGIGPASPLPELPSFPISQRLQGYPTDVDPGRRQRFPAEAPAAQAPVVAPSALAPRVQPGPLGGYGNEGRGNQPLPASQSKVDYSGVGAAPPAPTGLPPGVSTLRMDVPADGPIAKLGATSGSVLADAAPPVSAARAWGNASGQGPVIATLGNGITREDEQRIKFAGGTGAVLAANNAADSMKIARENAQAQGVLTRQQANLAGAQATEALAKPGLEDKRLGILSQEAASRTELGKGELAAKLELGRGELANRLKSIGLDERNVNRLDSLGNYEIEGKKLTAAHQQIVNDMTTKLLNAPNSDAALVARQNLLTALGKDPKDFTVHVVPGEKVKNPDGTESQAAGALAIVGPDGKANIVQMPKQSQSQYTKGERRQDPQTKEIREFDGKAWVKV